MSCAVNQLQFNLNYAYATKVSGMKHLCAGSCIDFPWLGDRKQKTCWCFSRCILTKRPVYSQGSFPIPESKTLEGRADRVPGVYGGTSAIVYCVQGLTSVEQRKILSVPMPTVTRASPSSTVIRAEVVWSAGVKSVHELATVPGKYRCCVMRLYHRSRRHMGIVDASRLHYLFRPYAYSVCVCALRVICFAFVVDAKVIQALNTNSFCDLALPCELPRIQARLLQPSNLKRDQTTKVGPFVCHTAPWALSRVALASLFTAVHPAVKTHYFKEYSSRSFAAAVSIVVFRYPVLLNKYANDHAVLSN